MLSCAAVWFIAESGRTGHVYGESSTFLSQQRRFWIAILCFALLNAGAWIVYDHHVRSAGRGLLRVEAFEPGDDAITGRRPTVRWRFNSDVIPTAAYGRSPATVSPAVAGKWRVGRSAAPSPSRRMAICPEATRISFTLADTFLRGPMGSTMGRDVFHEPSRVAPLAVESVRQVACLPGNQFILELQFNDRVSPAEVLGHLSATDCMGTKIKVPISSAIRRDRDRFA